MITMGELLHGTDEDFLTNLYLAALGRWPDEAGFADHLRMIAGRPENRAVVLRVFLDSEEGRQKGRPVQTDASPVSAEQALSAQLRLRTTVLRAEMAGLREAKAPLAPDSAALEEVAALRGELASLSHELRERMAALEAALAGRIPAAPNLSPAISLDYVNDLIDASQTQMVQRLRAIEKRLLENGKVEILSGLAAPTAHPPASQK